jgi:hypothetical protein
MQPMSTAPRDGTHILAYLYHAPDSERRGEHGEWREIWWKPFKAPAFGWDMPWHAGDDFDSREEGLGVGDSHYGVDVPLCWLPLPKLSKAQIAMLLLERHPNVDTYIVNPPAK